MSNNKVKLTMFMELMYFSGCDFRLAIVEAGWLQNFQMKSHNGYTFFYFGEPLYRCPNRGFY